MRVLSAGGLLSDRRGSHRWPGAARAAAKPAESLGKRNLGVERRPLATASLVRCGLRSPCAAVLVEGGATQAGSLWWADAARTRLSSGQARRCVSGAPVTMTQRGPLPARWRSCQGRSPFCCRSALNLAAQCAIAFETLLIFCPVRREGGATRARPDTTTTSPDEVPVMSGLHDTTQRRTRLGGVRQKSALLNAIGSNSRVPDAVGPSLPHACLAPRHAAMKPRRREACRFTAQQVALARSRGPDSATATGGAGNENVTRLTSPR